MRAELSNPLDQEKPSDRREEKRREEKRSEEKRLQLSGAFASEV